MRLPRPGPAARVGHGHPDCPARPAPGRADADGQRFHRPGAAQQRQLRGHVPPGLVHIDLHWSMLREARTRVDLTPGFLARRQQTRGVWGLADSDAVFMMLTHPAFGKYVCSPQMGLGRVADFMLWMQQKPVDWPAVLSLLEQAGLKTAAWAMLSWFRMLGQPEVTRMIDECRPPLRRALRAAYLQLWLTHDLPTWLWPRERWIQLAFTLFLHDRPADRLRVFHGVWQARRHRLRDARLLMGDDFEWGAL
ncbi:MAG: nucleotidyltransferase family protein [Comamonadaceae bacterium]|nr:nucleotidyltransferase family protein [Comamonadaceae bacterium]